MPQFNFPELIVQGREIDKRIERSKAKLLEPSKFGLGREAFIALKELKKEICDINSQCLQDLEIRKEEYVSVTSCNTMVNEYLCKIGDVLEKLESQGVAFGYQTYESSSSQNEVRVEKKDDYFDVSGIASLSLYESRLTPLHERQTGNRRVQLSGTTSPFTVSSWSVTSPIKSTPRKRYDNGFLSSTTRDDLWHQNTQNNGAHSNHF